MSAGPALVRDALSDQHARLGQRGATRPRLRWLPVGRAAPLGALLACEVFIDPEVLKHDIVVFAAGTQTESVRMEARELFASEPVTTVPLVKQAERGSDDPIDRRRAAQQDLAGGGHPAS
jgi:hypothetical protein